MEGERLLQRIKTDFEVDSLLRDLEVYLAPVLHRKSSPTQELSTKYGLYAMKMLRACVQKLTALRKGNAAVTGVILMANKSYECIHRTIKHTKTVPLSLEKLMFHMMVQSMAKELIADSMVFARNLYYHLTLCRHDFVTQDGVDNEYDTICKQAFNQLWKGCVDLEYSSKQGTRKHMVVLDVRLQALTFLMLTNYEVSWVVERALRAVAEFDRVTGVSHNEDNTQVVGFLRDILDTLHSNLGDSEKKEDLQEEEEASELSSPLFELSLQFAKRCCQLHKYEEALNSYEKLHKLITSMCNKNCHKLYTAAADVVIIALYLRKRSLSTDTSKNTQGSKSKPKDQVETMKDKIQVVVSCVSKINEKGDPDLTAINCLVEALEFFKKPIECNIGQQQDASQCSFSDIIPKALVESVNAVFNLLVDLLQLQREHLHNTCSTSKESSARTGKQHRLSLQKAINRQLALLNLMSSMLLHRMNRLDEDLDDDVISKYTQNALSVCQRTQRIIQEVSCGTGGSLSNNEHRWLGTNAYNLGLVCYRKKWYSEAVPLLNMACEELHQWCLSDKGTMNKVQLFSKYELLVDCQRKANQHRKAMQTAVTYLWTHIDHLTDHLTTPVELWVKSKRDAVKVEKDEQLRTRTLFDAIQEIEGTISDESTRLVSRLLEQELGIYKAQRYETTVEQYATVCDLLSLYSDETMRLHRAHTHIEQAQLLRDGTLDTDCCPVDCCKEAISLLEELAQDLVQQQQHQERHVDTSNKDYLVVFDLLATAYFWLYICESEANQATYVTSQFNTQEQSVPQDSTEAATCKKDKPSTYLASLSSYTLAAELSAVEPLDRALDIWTDLMADGCNQSMFNDPASTCYCLKVAASLCELADRPIQQVQALTLLVLVSIATSSNEDAILAYCQIIRALYCLGAALEAEKLLAQAQRLLDEAKTRNDDWAGVEATFMITKSYVMLGCHKISEFETLLSKVLHQHSHKQRRSRQTYMRNASIKRLQSLYLLLPPSQRSQDASIHSALVPDDAASALELRLESMRLQMGVGRLMFSEGVFSNEQGLQGDGFKLAAVGNETGCNDIEFNQWTVMTCVLQTLYDVGILYMEQGCIREAKSYLKEGLTLADKFMLPRRCAAFLLQVSNLYAQCSQVDDCQASLAKVQKILHLPEKASQTRPQDESTDDQDVRNSRCKASNEILEDDDDDFIKTKRISISAECSLRKRLPRDSATSSPTLRSPTVKLPSFHNHSVNCVCGLCTDVSLHSQELGLILRTAQCLELQGDTSQALTRLQVALYFGSWSAKKVPALLCKSCMSLQNTGCATKGKESGREKVNKAESSSQSPCDIHSKTISEIHVCLARLNLQNSCLAEADETIRNSLELPSLKGIPRAWLQFYKILASLELQTQGENTTIRDVLSAAWHIQPSSKTSTLKQSQEEELRSQFSRLDLGKPREKHHIQFQDSVFSSRMQRPEVSRKFSDKVSDPGIFCDISDSDDSDVIIVGETSVKTPGKTKKLIKATSKNVEMNSKKGSLVCGVKKKMPAKKIGEDNMTPLIKSAASVFDFDQPSPVKTKKTGTRGRSGRSAKTMGRRKTKVIDLDSDIDEVFEEETETKSKTGARSKRTTKKMDSLDEDAENANPPECTKSVPKSTKLTKSISTKARKSKPVEAVETPLPQSSTTKTRPKRGRKPNTENLRSEVVTQLSDNILTDLFSTSLELESPVKMNSTTSPNHNLHRLNFEDIATSLEPPSSKTLETLGSISRSTSSFILEDLDEIEIPRAGQDSDSDDSKTTLNVLRKTARKPVSKRKTSKKLIVEETEVLRGTKHAPMDDVQPLREKKVSTFAASGSGKVAKSSISKSASTLDTAISDLESLCTELRHHAPALLYRRVCHLLAMSHGDRQPSKAAYYLSEASAVTLRHQKLSSLTKKIKKVKKEMDCDSVQHLSDILAAASLGERSSRCESSLHHLTNEKTLFTFSRGPEGLNYPNVVQQAQEALPKGHSVCMISIASCGISPSVEMSNADSLLICRLRAGFEPVIINQDISPAAADLLEEFNSILAESKQSVKETDKKTWWTCRQQLDQRMQTLTETMEETLLGPWKGLLLGSRKNKDERQAVCRASEKLRGLLEATCKKLVDPQLCQCLVESFHQLSKSHLNSALSSLTGLLPISEQHSSLVSSIGQLVKGLGPSTSREPVILILDKQIQHLPWETTPILRETPVCRMPSLYFILSHLKAQDSASSQGVDPSNAFFVLNPSNDLTNTQKTFQKWFERENSWKGVVARPPTKDEYKAGLTDHQLFVFCGHGNGREFLTGDDIQRLTCQATSLLIGCSSGRLQVTGMQEACGMVLNYLVAECPCIVANLWDVTDRDIDRFLEQLLRSWLTEGGSLLDYMAKAREACKLQYLIGCSPVVYGLPVCLKLNIPSL